MKWALKQCVGFHQDGGPEAIETARAAAPRSQHRSISREGKIFGQPLLTYSSRDVSEKARDLYREAIAQSRQGCLPLPFTKDFANVIAGHPINFRVVDDRKDAGPHAGRAPSGAPPSP